MTLDTLLNWDRDSALAAAPTFRRLHPNWITTISLVLAGAGLWLLDGRAFTELSAELVIPAEASSAGEHKVAEAAESV